MTSVLTLNDITLPRVMVVDACAYGRAGMAAALNAPAGAPWQLSDSDTLAALAGYDGYGVCQDWQASRRIVPHCLVVRLPDAPQAAMVTLLELGHPMVRLSLRGCSLVMLSSHPFQHVRELLLSVSGRLSATWLVSARLSVNDLKTIVNAAMTRVEQNRLPCLTFDAGLRGRCFLTEPERRVLLASFTGVSLDTLAHRHAVSRKTLYSQRRSAILKLGAVHLHALFGRFAFDTFAHEEML